VVPERATPTSPARIYAYQNTGGLLPRPHGSFASGRDQAEWDEVISRYVRVHQAGSEVDHEAETRKLQNKLFFYRREDGLQHAVVPLGADEVFRDLPPRRGRPGRSASPRRGRTGPAGRGREPSSCAIR
jgi:hypothetical protein